MKDKIIYFGDPLCSWCYGFGPEISKVIDHYKDSMDFELVMGGLRPYGKEKMSQLKDMLEHHWEEVYKRSGQPFQYEILKNEDFVYDTEPPSRAVLAVKKLDPKLEFPFYKRVQKGFYFDNKNTNELTSYLDWVNEFNLDREEFTRLFESDSLKEETRKSFAYSQQLGVRGFPTTVLQQGENLFLLANGYAESELIIERIEKLEKEDQPS